MQTASWLQQKDLLDKISHPKNYNKRRVHIFHMNPFISVSSRYTRTVTRVKLQRLQQHEQEFQFLARSCSSAERELYISSHP